MLGRTYRIVVLNSQGTTGTVTVTARRWSFSASGVQTWEGSEFSVFNASSDTNGSYITSSTIDNSTNAYLGGTFRFTAAPAGSGTGTATMYLQRSTDGGTTWPDNGQGDVLAVLTWAATSTSQTTSVEV